MNTIETHNKLYDNNTIKNCVDNYMNSFIIKHSWFSIILVYNIVNLVSIGALNILIPVFMCYGRNVEKQASIIRWV